jgi:hypothetical protein
MKPLGQMIQNLIGSSYGRSSAKIAQIKLNETGSIYGRSSIRFPRFIPKTWSPWAILVSDWLKFKDLL